MVLASTEKGPSHGSSGRSSLRDEGSAASRTWSPASWRGFAAAQQPEYADEREVEEVTDRLRNLPPLVVSGEVRRLRALVARAAAGEAFLLQGGDCAERFEECRPDTLVRKLKILLQMSLVIADAARRPVVRIARLAGQYAKPRSAPTELVGGEELPAYRGDIINGERANADSRRPDPRRMEQAYFHACSTLNFLRGLVDGGFADLRRVEHWDLAFMGNSRHRARYQALADRICHALDLVGGLGALREDVLERVDFFTAHEGLLLPYEEAMTTRPPNQDGWFNLGAHFLWIGERTRQLDGAHVEYFRGIANPIGIKLGPSCTADELLRLLDQLDPDDEPGRICLISRSGAGAVARVLPPLVRAVRATGRRVQWSVDPMHGNTLKATNGLKTRSFDVIKKELEDSFAVHRAEGTRLTGVHFELTGDDVTECVGGAQGLSEEDLPRRYHTSCDPRLNHVQSLEIAFCVADLLRDQATQ